MNFRPFNDRVLVRPDTVAPRKSVLSNPDAQKEKPTTGVVLAVGPMALDVVGKRVQWAKYGGREITVNGEELRLLRFEELDGEFAEDQPTTNTTQPGDTGAQSHYGC